MIIRGLGTDLKRREGAQILVTRCASGLKRPHVGDVVTQVVDLELENKFMSSLFLIYSTTTYRTQIIFICIAGL